MLSICVLVASITVSQASSEGVYLFAYKDAAKSPTGEALVFGLWDGKRQSTLYYEILEPWRDVPRGQRVNPRDLEGEPEPAQDRMVRSYLDRGWEAAGGKQVRTAQGEMIWVHGHAATAHEAALRLRAEAFPEAVTPDAPPLTGVDLGGDAESPQPSFLQLWGLHIAIAAGGLLAAGVIAWWAFARSPWASVQT